jgi:segregation and condensation protein A
MVPDPLTRLRPERLRDAARRVLEAKPEARVDTDHVAPIRASVADAIVTVLDRLPADRTVAFRELARDATSRLDAIVRFLAVLELYKQGIVDLEQIENFGVLEVRRIADAELDRASIADWDEPTVLREPRGADAS